jgi:5-methylcytosine-specific restriction endonuclease McrA
MGKRRGKRGKRAMNLRAVVYERDGWECQMPECLCPDGRALDAALRGTNDPWAPTIDHVIELAAGGGSSRDNVRAAHRQCNMANAAELSRSSARAANRFRRPLTYRLGDLFPGDQGSKWS